MTDAFPLLRDIWLGIVAAWAGAATILWLRARNQNRTLRAASVTDPMTGLYTKVAFERLLRDAVSHALRAKHSLTVVFLDGNGFGEVNNRYGHDVGDRFIVQTARTLTRIFSRRTDRVGRVGGDEFAVLLTNADEEGAHAAIARFLKDAAHAKVEIPARAPIPVSLSLGAAVLSICEDSLFVGARSLSVNGMPTEGSVELIAAELMKEADRFMYEAKRIAHNALSGNVAVLQGRVVDGS